MVFADYDKMQKNHEIRDQNDSENMEIDIRKPKLEAEIGKWSLETEKWSLETVKWKPKGAKRTSEGRKSRPSARYPVPIPLVSGDVCAKSPDPRGDPSF